MAAVQDVPRLVLQAILASQSPQALPQQRKDAVAFLEQFKRADVASVLSVCASLISLQQLAQQYGALLQPSDAVGVRLAAYQLFTEAVRNRWRELSAEQRLASTQLALQQFREAVSPAQDPASPSYSGGAGGSFPERGKAAELLAVVVRQQGSAAYTELLPQLIAGASAGPAQAELSCRVLLYISEDLTQFEVSGPGGAVGASGDGAPADSVASPSGAAAADAPDVTSKRAFLSALTASAPTVFPFLCEVLEQHFQAAQQLQSAPAGGGAAGGGGGGAGAAAPSPEQHRRDRIAAHVGALSAALGALSTWVEWVPMRRLAASPVLSACAFFIREGTTALRMQALDVLRQITWRKRANETPADYTALMDGMGGALLGATGALGLLLGPQDPLPPAMVRELGYGGSQVEFGSRVLEVVEGLGEGHFRALSEQEGRRAAFLAQLLTFTRHPYLRLSGGTLTLWQQLLREAAPQHALAPGGGGGSGSGTAGGGSGGSGGGGQGSPGGKGGQSYSLPVEVVSELMRVLCGAMARVVPSADPGVANIPDWCDSHAEYKEVVVSYRSQAKAILRLAAGLAPEQGLQAAAALLSSALAACAAPPAAAAASAPSPTAQLEAAVLVLTAVLQPLCDLPATVLGVGGAGGMAAGGAAPAATTSPAAQAAAAALVGGVADLLQAVLRVRLSDPRHMTLHAEAIEAFGRFLVLRPDLAVPTVSCCLEVMSLLPLEAHGQLPPPARQTPEWRAHFEARLAMANVLLGLARAAPGALVPHLSALVNEITALWDRGLLREGERVLLWEGLLAASSAASPLMQSQLVQLIFGPIAQQWGSAEWQAAVASPQAFVQTYMPLLPAGSAQGAGGAPAAAAAAGGSGSPALELGSRDRRWTLYHQVTLLERALRRTTPPTASAPAAGAGPGAPAGGAGSGGGCPPEHAFNAHLEWCLPPVARLLACIHALADPRVRPSLGPLTLVNEMDALERATRLGEDRDVIKATEQQEPRCVAGANLADARYFVRGVRECAYMVLNLACLHCGPAMWRSEPLAALLPAAVGGGAPALGDAVVRLLVRHVLTPWAQRCPPARAGAWMVPLCGVFLPHMHERLSSGWAALQASGSGAAGGGAGGGAAAATAAAPGGTGPGRPAGAGMAAAGGAAGTSGGAGTGGGVAADAASDEVLRDVLLRELTREYLGFLNALASRRPVDDSGAGPGAAAGAAGAAGPSGAASGGSGSGTALLAAAGSAALSPRGSANGSGSLLQESLLEVLLRSSPVAAQAGLMAGVSALCWPDADSAAKAVAFCRSLLALAQSGHSELEGLVVGAVTRSAISSLGLVSTVLVQTQVLELLRSVLAAYLAPRPGGQPHAAQMLRGVLGELPGVNQQVLDGFTNAFVSAHGDKEQRALIKQLLAAVGGDEVRKLLAAVSKVPGGVTAVPEPKPKERGPISDVTPQDMGLPHLFDLPDVL